MPQGQIMPKENLISSRKIASESEDRDKTSKWKKKCECVNKYKKSIHGRERPTENFYNSTQLITQSRPEY